MIGLLTQVENALEVLGLPVLITQEDIKKQYHFLAKKYHPDQGGDEATMRALNEAYKVLMQYIASFRYTFSEEETRRQSPGENYAEQFRG